MNRRTFVVKRGCQQDLVAMMIEEGKRIKVDIDIPYRIYTPNIAPFDRVVAEWDFQDLAEYEKFWVEWFARPETEAFMEKWYKLTENGGTNEIWNLEE